MKTLLVTILFCFTANAQAMHISPYDMTADQKEKLIDVLNQMEPEMIEKILSEEAMEWYIDQFTRGGKDHEAFAAGITHGRVVVGDYNDPNAPVFN